MNGFDKDAVAACLRAERARAGMSQGELAEKSGVNVTTISAYERGDMVPGAGNLFALADALGCTPNDIMGWKPAA